MALPGCWRRLFSFLSLLWPPLSFPRAPHPPGLLEPLWGARGVYLTSLAGRSSCSLWHSRSQPSFPAQIWPWHSHRTLSSPRGLPGGRGGRVQSALGCGPHHCGQVGPAPEEAAGRFQEARAARDVSPSSPDRCGRAGSQQAGAWRQSRVPARLSFQHRSPSPAASCTDCHPLPPQARFPSSFLTRAPAHP